MRIVSTSEPSFDFDAFVADRRGIAREQAEALIASWLGSYQPRGHGRPNRPEAPALSEPPNELRSCA